MIDGPLRLLPGQGHQFVHRFPLHAQLPGEHPAQCRQLARVLLIVGPHHLAEQRRHGELQGERLSRLVFGVGQHLLKESLNICEHGLSPGIWKPFDPHAQLGFAGITKAQLEA